MCNLSGPHYANLQKSVLDEYLGEEVTRQMLLRAKRDLTIREIEELERAIAVQSARKAEISDNPGELVKVEAELRRLAGKRAEWQEMLYQLAERLEQKERDVEKFRKEWIRMYNSRESYPVSEKMPPLGFRMVILAFWAAAILILVGILSRG